MAGRLSALSIALFTALLAGSPVQRWSVAWPLEAAHQWTDASGAPLRHALPSSRVQPALHLRFPADRQGSVWALAALHQAAPVTLSRVLPHLDAWLAALPGESARHYPRFPTGPPSQG
jgi:hypothetical protein